MPVSRRSVHNRHDCLIDYPNAIVAEVEIAGNAHGSRRAYFRVLHEEPEIRRAGFDGEGSVRVRSRSLGPHAYENLVYEGLEVCRDGEGVILPENRLPHVQIADLEEYCFVLSPRSSERSGESPECLLSLRELAPPLIPPKHAYVVIQRTAEPASVQVPD